MAELVFGARWQLEEPLVQRGSVEVQRATDVELGRDVLVALWPDRPHHEEVRLADDLALLDHGADHDVWFAAYGPADGSSFTRLAAAVVAGAIASGGETVATMHRAEAAPVPPIAAAVPVAADATAPIAAVDATPASGTPVLAEEEEALPPPPSRRNRVPLLAAALAALVLLVAIGIGLAARDEGNEERAAAPEAGSPISDSLLQALRELRAAAGAESERDIAEVRGAVLRRDRAEAEAALTRIRRRDRARPDGSPGPIAVAVDRVRALLPPPPGEEPPAAPCAPEETTTTSSSSTSSTSSSSTSTTSTTAAPDGSTTTNDPCATTTTTVPTTTTTRRPITTSTSTSSTSTTSTSTTTTVPSTTTSTSTTTTSTTTP